MSSAHWRVSSGDVNALFLSRGSLNDIHNHRCVHHHGGGIFEMRIGPELISGGRARQPLATELCALHITHNAQVYITHCV